MSVFGQLQTVKLASDNDCSSAEAAVSRSLRYQDRLGVRFPLDEGSLPTRCGQSAWSKADVQPFAM